MRSDTAEILQIIAAYGVHTDARRWGKLIGLFAPEVRIDYTALQGGTPTIVRATDLIEAWQAFLPGFTGTSHLIGLPIIEQPTADSARAEAPFTAWHVIKGADHAEGDQWGVGGRYEFELSRLDGRWHIGAVKLVPVWQLGNRQLPAMVAERARSQRQS